VSAATVVCLVCRVDFDGQPDAAHAAYFAGVHDDLHHGSTPTAFTAPAELTDAAGARHGVVGAVPAMGKSFAVPGSVPGLGPWGGDAA
jgi:hypothetical protein